MKIAWQTLAAAALITATTTPALAQSVNAGDWGQSSRFRAAQTERETRRFNIGASGQLERIPMPLERAEPLREPCEARVSAASAGEPDGIEPDLPWQLALPPRVHRSAERLRDELRAQADAEHRLARGHVAADRFALRSARWIARRSRLVRALRPAHH